MKAGGGRNKGNTFERAVAKTIVMAFSRFGITNKDCYRTPSSGGHKYAKKEDPGDLVISPKLRKLFPFHVECKHYKRVELFPLWMLGSNAYKKSWKFKLWMEQATRACGYVKKKPGALSPMVVFKANGNSPIMCLLPEKSMRSFPAVRLRFIHLGEVWYATRFDALLKVLVRSCRR